MADLFAEVDEVMRQERLAKVWHDYGAYIIAFVVGVIVLTGVFSGYKSWNNSVRERQTANLIALQDADNYPQNVLDAPVLELRPGLRGIAYLSAAGAFLDDGRREEALALYERGAADGDIPVAFAHLADLMVVRMSIDEVADEAGGAALLARMEKVYSDAGSPWGYHARLEAAVIEAHLNGDYVSARAHLAVIQGAEGLPKSLYEKADALDHVYGLKVMTEETGVSIDE